MIVWNIVPYNDLCIFCYVLKLDTFQYQVQVFDYSYDNGPFIVVRKERYPHDLKVIKKPIIDDDKNDK